VTLAEASRWPEQTVVRRSSQHQAPVARQQRSFRLPGGEPKHRTPGSFTFGSQTSLCCAPARAYEVRKVPRTAGSCSEQL
jgi:hypothetical protein